jgi:hypothetical protein
MANRILVAVALLVGVVLGCAAAPFMVPKASAQQAALPAFEYLCGNRPAFDDMTSAANQLAAQRWELATIEGQGWCWKRPKM